MSKSTSQIEQSQLEKLTELGVYLRQVREDNEVTLEQISAKTMIQIRLLNAIETGNLAQLPEPVYVQGFIKRYADALGLNGVEVAHAFPTTLDIRAVQPSWKDSPAAQLRPIHLYVAYTLLIAAAIGGLSYLMSRSASWVSAGIANRQQSAVESPSQANVAPNRAASPAISPAIADKPVRVDVTLTAQSWLRIEIDGKTEFQGILPEGTQKTWMANKQLTVRAGNAGAVMLAYNKGHSERMGVPGAVKEVTFSTDEQAASLPNFNLDLLPR